MDILLKFSETTIMKTAIITLMCMVAASFPLSVQVEECIKTDDRIVTVEVLVYEDIILAALRTKPVFTRSENAEILKTARKNAETVTDGTVIFLSIDADIYNQIIYLKRKGGNDTEKIYELALKMRDREKTVLDIFADYENN